jgi:hypothetical protein
MADPICRWRNPYFKTARELIATLPKENLSSISGRELTNENWGEEFFGTPYQLACQLGLYYELKDEFIVRFNNNPTPYILHKYLRNWITNYYVPNPYTKKGFDNINPKIIHVEIAKILKVSKSQYDWSQAKNELFGEPIGNDDILINAINNYSEVFEIKSNKLKLKDGIEYEDLDNYIYEYELNDRNDKKGFFDVFELNLIQNNLQRQKNLLKAKSPKNIIYYGAPGTGKSHTVDKKIEALDTNYYERVTFHPEYDNASFMGGYKPISVKERYEDEEGHAYFENEVHYKFVPQAFTNIYERAWKDTDNQYYLVIEEINRGNCAEIFGEIFQLLDRTSKYTVSASKELKEYFVNEAFKDKDHPGIINGLKLPPNLSILATMNTSDQSLFPMDSAFKRRWDWEYIPICYTQNDEFKNKNDSFYFEIDIEDGKKYKWIEFIEKINLNHIKFNPSLGMDKCIGNYFIKPDKDNIISLKPLINKVIFFLWNDVFKDEDNKVFEVNTSYEDFFPMDINGKRKIKELFDRIELKPIPSSESVEGKNPLVQVVENKVETES